MPLLHVLAGGAVAFVLTSQAIDRTFMFYVILLLAVDWGDSVAFASIVHALLFRLSAALALIE